MQSTISTFFSKQSQVSRDRSKSPSPRESDPPHKRSKNEINVEADSDTENVAWEHDTEMSESSETESEGDFSDRQNQTETDASTAATLRSKCPDLPAQITKKMPGPSDISQGRSDTPRQPELITFPSHQIGNRLRSFKKSWYDKHKWIEYSVLEDAAYCFCCRQFPKPGKIPEAAFVSTGYRQWKKATERDSGFSKHEKSDFHNYAFCSWKEFKKQLEQGKTIKELISSAHAKQVSENRHYIMQVAKVLCLTGRQKIALRGHDEGPESLNKGNFLEILHLVGEEDEIVREYLSKKRGKYTSPGIQKEIIGIMEKIILNEISSEVAESQWFSIIADESKDMSGKEQLSVVVRYLYQNTIYEEFLGFIHLLELDAQGLKKSIYEVLQKCNIDLKNCVGQTYDGASVMSGQSAGVQALIQNDVPQATYIHCYNHRLNLVIVETVKAVKLADQFFGILEAMYVFLSSSVAHEVFMKKQEELLPGQQPRMLKKISDTRWSCQYAMCKVMIKTIAAVYATLEEISSEHRGKRAVDATSLLKAMNFSFLLSLVMFSDLLHRTKLLSDMLQSPTLDLAAAADMVETVREDILKQRSHDIWSSIWDTAENLAKEVEIPVEISIPKRKKRVSLMLKDSVVMETTGQDEETTKQSLCTSLFYPVLDNMLSEFDRRFNKSNIQLLHSIAALDPRSSKFMDINHIQHMALQYNVETEYLNIELTQAKRLVSQKQSEGVAIDSVARFQAFMEPYKDAFPALCKLLAISLILPPTSASCERSFSSMRMIKSYLRSSMGDSTLSGLSVLGIHTRRAKALDMKSVVSAFARNHNNRSIELF